MRRHTEAAVDELRDVLGILRALRRGFDKGNANALPVYADCVLVALAMHSDGTTMREIREDLHLWHSSVTRACYALEREGLVQLSRDPADRRRTLVKLTQRGHGLIDDVLSAFRGRRR
jgi:MarR family protein